MNHSQPPFFKSLLTLFLALFSLLVQAQDATEEKELKYYDVEIVIFKNVKVPKSTERTQAFQTPEFDEIFIDLASPTSIEEALEYGYSTPTNEELRLKDVVKKISHSTRYKLLVHTAWRQPGLKLSETLSFRVRGGDTFGNDYSSIDDAVEPVLGHPVISLIDEMDEPQSVQPLKQITDENTDENQNNEEEPLNTKVWYELEGKITVSLKRYLHTYADLVLRVPNDNNLEITTLIQPLESNNPEQTDELPLEPEQDYITSSTLNNYSLKEHRRMRSKRLHYLDHPELGMLVLITQYIVPTEEELMIEEAINKSVDAGNPQTPLKQP